MSAEYAHWTGSAISGYLNTLTYSYTYDSSEARALCEASRRVKHADVVLAALEQLVKEIEGEDPVTWFAMKRAQLALRLAKRAQS